MSSTLKKILLSAVILLLVGAVTFLVVVGVMGRSNSDGADSGTGLTDADGDKSDGAGDGAGGGDKTPDNTGDKSDGAGGGNAAGNKYDGLFAGTSTEYKLSSDYTLTDADARATLGNGNVALIKACSFDLGGHTLNLGGKTLNINVATKDVVKFENGKIANGKINISIPKGDIEFTQTEIDASVTYELEAANETIRFSNAVIKGKCTIKSDTHVKVEYSNVSDISFTGSGMLTAGSGAVLGTVTLTDGAKGAALNIAPTATVQKLEINAPATVSVSGSVSQIVLESAANGTSVVLNDTATVDILAIKAGNAEVNNRGANVAQAVVSAAASGSLKANGITPSAVSDADMQKYAGHLHVLKVVSSREATCVNDGEIVKECKACGEKATLTQSATGHSYVRTTVKEPTISADGQFDYKCSKCSDVKRVTISKEDAKYYHMNIVMVSADNTGYETLRLRFVDGDDEHYILTRTRLVAQSGAFSETEYKVRLQAVNGLPEVKPVATNYCTDWLKLTFSHEASANVTVTKIAGDKVKLTPDGYTVIGGVKGEVQTPPAQIVKFAGSCFFAEKTLKTSFEEVHDLSATGKLSDGSTACGYGVSITISCKKCTYTKTETKKEHYYVGLNKQLTTQCDDSKGYFRNRQCVVCGVKDVSCSLDSRSHTVTTNSKTVLTVEKYNETVASSGAESTAKWYLKITDLAAYGFDTAGFYRGSYSLAHCAICGINVHTYTYNTYTAQAGCLQHTAYYAEYKGNVDYEEFEFTAEDSAEGHYAVYGASENYPNVNAGVTEAQNYIEEGEIPFEPVSAKFSYYACGGCGKKYRKYIVFGSQNTDYGDFSLRLYYDDNTEVTDWSYECSFWGRIPFDRLNELGCFSAELISALEGGDHSSNGRLSRSKDHGLVEELNFRNNDIMFSLTRYGLSSMSTEDYRVRKCAVTYSSYHYSEGSGWQFANSEKGERHSDRLTVFGKNCREDYKGCEYCHKVMGNEHNIYSGWSGYFYDADLIVQTSFSDSNLSGLSALIIADGHCHDCGTLVNANITLREDWTLTNDVYLRAEGISLDLNGYSIDLNGYNLVLYSYAGERVVITDNTFDTSTVEDYNNNPDGVNYTSKIKNTGSSGVLVAATGPKACQNAGAAEITVGTVNIECDNFLSDKDDRYTLYDSLSKAGYNVPCAEAHRMPPPNSQP